MNYRFAASYVRVMIRASVALLQVMVVDILVELLRTLGIEQELG
jgi:hypothetical protein